jgi:hypothetical protein
MFVQRYAGPDCLRAGHVAFSKEWRAWRNGPFLRQCCQPQLLHCRGISKPLLQRQRPRCRPRLSSRGVPEMSRHSQRASWFTVGGITKALKVIVAEVYSGTADVAMMK